MNDPAVLGSEVLASLLAYGLGWFTSKLYGLHALRAQRAALRRAELLVKEKEAELTEQVERALRGQSAIDGETVTVLITHKNCPNCRKAEYISRSPRCYGHKGECPSHIVHHHSRCRNCNVDWVEATIERTIRDEEQEKKKREAK